jgi:hypothetical protein
MAMTAIDLMCDEAFAREIKAEFAATSVTPPARP